MKLQAPPRMKICGLTRKQDVSLVSSLGVHYAGFILTDKSPRGIALKQAQGLAEALAPTTGAVAVMLEPSIRDALLCAKELRVAFAQLHGDISLGLVERLRDAGFKVAVAGGVSDLSRLITLDADLVVLDNSSPGAHGGTGRPFDWVSVKRKVPRNLMLAGGLSAHNFSEGYHRFHPLILDFNSRVELQPGIKSRSKVEGLMTAYRREFSL